MSGKTMDELASDRSILTTCCLWATNRKLRCALQVGGGGVIILFLVTFKVSDPDPHTVAFSRYVFQIWMRIQALQTKALLFLSPDQWQHIDGLSRRKNKQQCWIKYVRRFLLIQQLQKGNNFSSRKKTSLDPELDLPLRIRKKRIPPKNSSSAGQKEKLSC